MPVNVPDEVKVTPFGRVDAVEKAEYGDLPPLTDAETLLSAEPCVAVPTWLNANVGLFTGTVMVAAVADVPPEFDAFTKNVSLPR